MRKKIHGLIRCNGAAATGATGTTPEPVVPVVPVPTAPTSAVGVQSSAGTLTQEQVNAIATAEKEKGERRGRQDALAEIEQKLGGVKLDDLLESHKKQQEAEDKLKSEAQLAAEAAVRAQAEADAKLAQAGALLHQARVTQALTSAGILPTAINATVVPGITQESTDDEIVKAVEALKTAVPQLFGAVATPIPNANPLFGAPAAAASGGVVTFGNATQPVGTAGIMEARKRLGVSQ